MSDPTIRETLLVIPPRWEAWSLREFLRIVSEIRDCIPEEYLDSAMAEFTTDPWSFTVYYDRPETAEEIAFREMQG